MDEDNDDVFGGKKPGKDSGDGLDPELFEEEKEEEEEEEYPEEEEEEE